MSDSDAKDQQPGVLGDAERDHIAALHAAVWDRLEAIEAIPEADEALHPQPHHPLPAAPGIPPQQLGPGPAGPAGPPDESAGDESAVRRSRRYCFVGYRPGDQDDDKDLAWCEAERDRLMDDTNLVAQGIRYCIMGIERGDAKRRWHIQGYMERRTACLIKNLKSFHPTFHFIVADGDAESNIRYCAKGEGTPEAPLNANFRSFGSPVSQGQRSDLKQVADALVANTDFRAVALEHSSVFLRYGRHMRALHELAHQPPPRPQPLVYRIDGPPGMGKSFAVFAHLRELVDSKQINGYYVVSETHEGWFDGYSGQDVIVFEDFVGLFPLPLMLKLLDFNPLRLWVKSASVLITASIFFFTSNSPLEDFYPGLQHDAWVRRIDRRSPSVFSVPLRALPQGPLRQGLRLATGPVGASPDDGGVPRSAGPSRSSSVGGEGRGPGLSRSSSGQAGAVHPGAVPPLLAAPASRGLAAGPLVLADLIERGSLRREVSGAGEPGQDSDVHEEPRPPPVVPAPQEHRPSSPRRSPPGHHRGGHLKRKASRTLTRDDIKRLRYCVDDEAQCVDDSDDWDDEEGDWE